MNFPRKSKLFHRKKNATNKAKGLSKSNCNCWYYSCTSNFWFSHMKISRIMIVKLALTAIGMTLVGLALFGPYI